MIKSRPLTATGLRLILSISLFAVAFLAGGAFLLVQRSLKDVATTVSHTVVDANASRDNVQTLQQIQRQLVTDKDVVERTRSIVADSQSYQYQDQIITDLNDYANQSGIVITNMDFAADQAATPGTTSSSSSSITTPTPKTPTPAGVKSTSVSIALKNPVDYNSLLRFIKSIEQNLTKMQISRVSLAKDSSGKGVTSETLTIEVYIR